MIFALTGLPPKVCFSAPARSSQSSARMTSASASVFFAAGTRRLAGGAACSRWSVGKDAASLIWVITRMSSFSASATRAFQWSSRREPRPQSITGFLAFDSSFAAASISASAGRTIGGGA